MSDRLRKLDALFAERVLGCEVKGGYHPRCGCVYHVHCDDERIGDGRDLLPYTRSLDAAWEGMTKLHLDVFEVRKIVLMDDTSDGSNPYHVEVWGSKSGGAGYTNHPAEALVLACLRAVGVGEDELA